MPASIAAFLQVILTLSLGYSLVLAREPQTWLEVAAGLPEAGLWVGEPVFSCSKGPEDPQGRLLSGLPDSQPCQEKLWCSLPVRNDSGDTLVFFANTNFFPLLTWALSETGRVLYEEKGGTQSPLPRGKAVETRHHFQVIMPPGSSRTLWLCLPYPVTKPLPDNFFLQLRTGPEVFGAAYQDYFERRRFVGLYFGAQAIMAFQFFFAIVLWLLARQSAYLHYGLYIFSLMGVFYLQYTDFLFMPRPFWLGAEEYYTLGVSMTFLAIFFYLRFGRSFLKLDRLAPREAGWVRRTEWFTLGFILVFVLLSPWPEIRRSIYHGFSFFCFVFAVVMAFRLSGKKLPLGLPFLMGSSALALGAFLNLAMSLMIQHFDWQPPVEGLNLLLLGVLVELVFFSAALAWKLRMDEREVHQTQKALLRKSEENTYLHLQMSQMRERIASDLHDEIGGTLSSLGIYSEVARKEIGHPARVLALLDKITQQAETMLSEMRDTVWALTPRNESFEALLQRMKDSAASLLVPKGIEYAFITEPDFPNPTLNLEQRQHLLRWYKEVLHNLVRHSSASHACIRITQRPDGFFLEVEDDGKGFDPLEKTAGQGLYNLKARAKAMGGHLQLSSAPGQGTRICLSLPLPQNGDSPSS